MSSSPPIPLDNQLGAAFIGIIISTAIYGITCLQVYHYYTKHCERDGVGFKIFVGLLLVLDSLHVALLAIYYYFYTVTNFGNVLLLQDPTWSLFIEIIVGDFMTLLVQMFFAFRIYHLTEQKLLIPIIICILGLAHIAVAIVFITTEFHSTGAKFIGSPAEESQIPAFVAISIACDTIITASMIYYLRRNRSPFQKTNRAINLLIAYVLNTCLLTTLCTLVCLILSVLFPDELWFLMFYFILVRLYSCTFMSTLPSLNSRQYVRAQLSGARDTDTADIISLSAFHATSRNFGERSGSTEHEQIGSNLNPSAKPSATTVTADTHCTETTMGPYTGTVIFE
ncbi:hypothetical protein BT96DRAFT_975198 [Gymnopus androsaceus JB14]|uniref:DUF6534 domain-containing protein n=1 Tax=Gymnopus androsaceus JB14 TaxID=1447944 RepID=A0A6A4HSJ2_9AGAR|nr:hypothetical protein BT96DRAFT_975198 [Gymnopus androsaceus JB14]